MVLKKKTFWIMLFIITLGTALRLIFINKPDGLWNDEFMSYYIASIPIGKKFIEAMFTQCHMPFYYLYLKFSIHFLGNNDLILRLTSVFPGILSILSMYYAGKEIAEKGKEQQTGILCASITALSSFLIYFSQEVRFYQLLFLFSSLSLVFTLRLCKKQTISNLIFYIITNLLIIFTHTIGFIFVGFNLLFTSYTLLKDKEHTKKIVFGIWTVILILTLTNIPLLTKIYVSHPFSQWWGTFTISRLGFFFTDYFSPVLTNIVSAPNNFFYDLSLKFVVFALIPTLIAISGIIRAILSKKYEVLGLLYLNIAFIFTLIILAISGKLMFITKYSIEAYPILIALAAFGLLELKKGWRESLIFLFCFLNLFYILANDNSAPKMHRSEGHKIVADLLNNSDLKKGDFILLTYYPQIRFAKYFNFNNYRVTSIDKSNFEEYLGVKNKNKLKNINPNIFEKQFKKNVLSKLNKNDKLVVILLKDVSMYSPTQIDILRNNNKEFNKAPYAFIAFSEVKNKILNNATKVLQLVRIEDKGSWAAITFIKK